MKIVIADINEEFVNAIQEELDTQCVKKEHAEVFLGSFNKVPGIDCMVAAGNSFGNMGGGIDLAIRNFLGHRIQDIVMFNIKEEFLGELPVGESIIVDTLDRRIPTLVYTPTTRIPRNVFKINREVPYVATWSAITKAHHYSKTTKEIKTLVIPGMATGAGGFPAKIAAKLMVMAISNYIQYQNKTATMADGRFTDKSIYS